MTDLPDDLLYTLNDYDEYDVDINDLGMRCAAKRGAGLASTAKA